MSENTKGMSFEAFPSPMKGWTTILACGWSDG